MVTNVYMDAVDVSFFSVASWSDRRLNRNVLPGQIEVQARVVMHHIVL